MRLGGGGGGLWTFMILALVVPAVRAGFPVADTWDPDEFLGSSSGDQTSQWVARCLSTFFRDLRPQVCYNHWRLVLERCIKQATPKRSRKVGLTKPVYDVDWARYVEFEPYVYCLADQVTATLPDGFDIIRHCGYPAWIAYSESALAKAKLTCRKLLPRSRVGNGAKGTGNTPTTSQDIQPLIISAERNNHAPDHETRRGFNPLRLASTVTSRVLETAQKAGTSKGGPFAVHPPWRFQQVAALRS